MHLVIPDLWQQEAVRALQQRRDVVLHAPTGAGKTFVFELLYPSLKGQAIFTVPTRALANDKLAEWRARGWDVGIATGDLALRPDAKVLVATLETQTGKFLRREGPRLLVVDEYQMIGDPARGVHYEMALALAPPETQLLLLSGSVGNPGDVVSWLARIGRDPVLVSHPDRPVPLTEVDLLSLPQHGREQPGWPALVARALRAGLGPILVFAPRRNASEELARALAASLPPDEPLLLSQEQKALAGPKLARLLAGRVAYHHSGLSYAVRAGIIEPLAKNGHLRVVVATMGLAAGINFSMRSVLVIGTRYNAGNFERHLQPDELLQMFGRAGRRGLDEAGHLLVAPELPRLHSALPRHLKRAGQVDWPSLIAVMHREADPFGAAAQVTARLFTGQPILLGVERSRETGPMPCGLWVDMERARFARRGQVEILNSAGMWEARQGAPVHARLGDLLVRENERWVPALRLPRMLDGVGAGNLCRLGHGLEKKYGREVAVAAGEPPFLTKWARILLRAKTMDRQTLETEIARRLPEASGGGSLFDFVQRGNVLVARIDFSDVTRPAYLDSLGAPLLAPPEREAVPFPCRGCPEFDRFCTTVEIVPAPAYAWRRLGLIDPEGRPTRRGVLFSFFNHGEGLAIAAALEDESYPMDALIFDLANLRAGHRFSEQDSPHGGRLGILCQAVYERADHPGYLEMGVPAAYGAGASEVVRDVIQHGVPKYKLLTDSLRPGDIERALIEWRSLLRHIVHAPDYDFPRWRALKAAAAHHVEATSSPASGVLPALSVAQGRRRLVPPFS